MPPQVVLITGTSSGLGQACAAHLATLGHRVYGTSRGADPELTGASPWLIRMDVREDDSVRAAVELVLDREGRLDAVVNSAGVGMAGSVEDTTPQEAAALFDTNFFGAHRVCRAVLPTLRRQGFGLVVNVSSLGGRVTVPFQGFYTASKFALESMTEALRMEAAPFGIRVTMIEPGDFRTDFTAHRIFARSSGPGSAYDRRCRRAVSVMENDERNGADPTGVAQLLEALLESDPVRPRYPVGGWTQRLAVGLKRFLPGTLFERGVAAYYRVG